MLTFPDNVSLCVCYGEVLGQAGDPAGSLKSYANASVLEPEHPLPYLNASRVYQQLNQLTLCKKHMAKAFDLDRSLSLTLVDIAQFKLHEKRFLDQGEPLLSAPPSTSEERIKIELTLPPLSLEERPDNAETRSQHQTTERAQCEAIFSQHVALTTQQQVSVRYVVRAANQLHCGNTQTKLKLVSLRLRLFYVLTHSHIPIESLHEYITTGSPLLKDLVAMSDVSSEAYSTLGLVFPMDLTTDTPLDDSIPDVDALALTSTIALTTAHGDGHSL